MIYKCTDGGEQPHEHKPTLESRAKVVGFMCGGFNQEQVATYFKISSVTLRKHYSEELDKSRMDRMMVLTDNLYKDAVEGCKSSREFWLKTIGRLSFAKPQEEKDATDRMVTVLERLENKL